jgi:hypothetical protein
VSETEPLPTALPGQAAARPWWRRPRWVVAGAVLVACIVLVASASFVSDFLAERRYRAAAADADRLNPGWRAESLVSRLEPIPESGNSARRVSEISDEIGALPVYAPGVLWQLFQSEPTERLHADQAAILRSEVGPLETALAKARALADLPRGRYPRARPIVTTLEPVPGSNLSRPVPFSRAEDDVNRVAYLLADDAILHAEAGDCAGALISTRAIFNVGRSFGDEPSRLAQEVRSRVTGLASRHLERVLAQGEAPEPLLASFQGLLEDEDAQPGLLTALRGDRVALDELFGKVVAGEVPRTAIPGAVSLPALFRFFLDRNTLRENRIRILEELNELVEAAKLPDGERESRVEVLLNRYTAERGSRGVFSQVRHSLEDKLLLNAYSTAGWSRVFAAWRRTAIAPLAAERYRLIYRRWPERLDQLVPRWLASVPHDPFSKGPILLRQQPDGLFVYSVGWDQRDDGGKYDPRNAVGRDADAGFRLWDPGHRRKPPKQGTRMSKGGKESTGQ